MKGCVRMGTSSTDRNACEKIGAKRVTWPGAASRLPWPRFGTLVGGIARAPSAAGSCEGSLRMRGGSCSEGPGILVFRRNGGQVTD